MKGDNYKKRHVPTPGDPKAAGLDADLQSLLSAKEAREAVHDQKLQAKLNAHGRHLTAKGRQLDVTLNIEFERLAKLLTERNVLESEIMAGDEIASKALAKLGLGYEPEKTTTNDVYALTGLHESEAAELAGIGGVHLPAVGSAGFIKWIGMAGSFALMTIGLGAIFGTEPKHLLTKPAALILAACAATVPSSGVYVALTPLWRHAGTLAAGIDDVKRVRALRIALMVSGVALIVVGLLDAEAILAINAPRALVDPEHAMPHAMAFAIGCCMSALYVIGTGVLAYADNLAVASRARIEAEQRKRERGELDDQRHCIEVRNAIEALNTVGVQRKRLAALDESIAALQGEIKATIEAHYSDIPDAPDMPEEHKADLRAQKAHAKFAEWKVQAQNDTARFQVKKEGKKS